MKMSERRRRRAISCRGRGRSPGRHRPGRPVYGCAVPCPNALESSGNRSTVERARQQLAATLLNLAAGDLFPENGKCALFEENNITSNACGDNLNVGAGVADSKSGITSGDPQAEHEALECLDDINNEIGVIQ